MDRREGTDAAEPACKRVRIDSRQSIPPSDDAAEVQRIVGRVEPASEIAEKLHPHQREAVLFILRRLTFSYEGIVARSDHDAAPSTGAILADEMGTGKVEGFPRFSSFRTTLYCPFPDSASPNRILFANVAVDRGVLTFAWRVRLLFRWWRSLRSARALAASAWSSLLLRW